MATALERHWTAQGFDRPLVWNTSPLLAPVAAHVKTSCAAVITDSTDNWLLHPDRARTRERIRTGYLLAGETSDLVTSTSPALTEFFGEVGEKALWVPNGVRYDLYARALDDECAHAPLDELPRPRIVWVGVLSDAVDMEVFEKIGDHFAHASLVCVGDGPADMVRRMQHIPNCRWMGFHPPRDIVRYLAGADVGIVAYRRTPYTRHMAPMKAYEYLAAGVPVVSTPMCYEDALAPWVRIADTPEELCRAVAHAVESDSPMQRHARSEAMRGCAWSARLDTILDRVV